MKKLPVAKFKCLSCEYSDYRMSALEVGELAQNECPKCGKDLKVVAKEPPEWLAELLELVTKHFDISDFVASKDRVELEATARNPKQSFRSLLDAAKQKGYLPAMRKREGELRLMMMRYPRVGRGRISINLLLLGVTFLTTFLAGYFLISGYFLIFDRTLYAALFSVAIMLMLGAHEIGHKIAAWRNGVESTLPYFIPAPTILGTLGAVIRIKSPIPTKEALVEMGATGPLFGFIVALPLTAVGLMLSKPDEGLSLLFTPAIFAMLQVLAFGYVPAAMSINPLAFAGWVVLLVTMFNLLPAGQLDGGHVARGLMSRERHYEITRMLGFSLLLFGLFFPELPLWIFGFLILLLFRGYHMGALDDVSKLSKRQKWLAVATFIVFLLCLPIPSG
ncbi:MAG: site-2 protease family protein [Hadesarchaea archaeon]|nr:site-2 protease family protein [Hadesarchaea archaeon]MDH5685143.1 site-2 protease family protein [Hadesarchaea archaeon]